MKAIYAAFVTLLAAVAPASAANGPTLDLQQENSIVPRGSAPLPIGDAPSAPPAPMQSFDASTARSANPLWGIPVKSLSATRERPIFLPSRRAPAPAVAATPAPAQPAAPVAPKAADSGPPPLKLVGVVAGTTESIAIFITEGSRDIVRLKTGEGHDGWILRSAKERGVTLEKDNRTATFTIPPPGAR